MRRVQPDACTFILTGYPDLETAIQAIRSQVDDYFSKPLHIDRLVGAISAVRSGQKAPLVNRFPRARWRKFCASFPPSFAIGGCTRCWRDPELAALPLSEAERSDHIPDMMDELIRRLEGPQEELSDGGNRGHWENTANCAISRVTQSLKSSLRPECCSTCSASTIHENLFGIDLSTLVGDILEIGETLRADAEISIRVYQSQIPRSLQTSFSLLYQSPYLGVAIADENRIIDGNDAFLQDDRTHAHAGDGRRNRLA